MVKHKTQHTTIIDLTYLDSASLDVRDLTVTMMLKVLLSLLVLPTLAEADVLSLDVNNYENLTVGRTVFIKFFAPWCGHCRAMAEDWEKLAEDWKDHAVGLVAEVDCTTDEGLPLCEDFEVQGFPTLLYGDPVSPETYEGGREYEELAAFAKEHISKPICNVFTLDNCDDEQKSVIESLNKKSKEELEQISADTERLVVIEDDLFNAKVEELQNEFEKVVDAFNTKVAEIKKEHNYKFVEQLLAKFESDEDDDDGEEEGNSEL